MNSLLRVLLAGFVICCGLYLVIAQFLGTTTELHDSLDLKSLAYIRLEEKDGGKPGDISKPGNVPGSESTPVNSGPERVVEDLIIAPLRKERLPEQAPATVRAVDVSLETRPDCDVSGVSAEPVSVQYRFESATIRGVSLPELEQLVAAYRRCGGGRLQFSANPLVQGDSTQMLSQMRMNELKYFFLQHGVPKASLHYPTNP